MKKIIRLICYFIVAAAIFFFDRITKQWALSLQGEYIINDYVSFDLTFNRGISWGFFSSSHATQFYIVTALICLIMLWLCGYTVLRYRTGNTIFGEILVLAGGISNIYDRFYYDGVIDFIGLSYGNLHWPFFNIADVAIVIGVGLMLYTACKEL